MQFFVGTLDISDIYCDDIHVIARKYVTSLTGFWIDSITSVPWSINDLYSRQVCLCQNAPTPYLLACAPAHTRIQTELQTVGYKNASTQTREGLDWPVV
jgi:hypothetical protein